MPKFSRNSLTFHRLGESYHSSNTEAENRKCNRWIYLQRGGYKKW